MYAKNSIRILSKLVDGGVDVNSNADAYAMLKFQ